MKKRTIALFMAAVMLFGVTVGSTIAWLTAKTSEVTNTFTFGNIVIDIYETKVDEEGDPVTPEETTKENEYDLVPGQTSVKDPKVNVEQGSEKCYVFVKVTEINNLLDGEKIVDFDVDGTHWLATGVENMYVYSTDGSTPAIVDATAGDVETESVIAVIEGTTDNIKVNPALTEVQIAAMAGKEATEDEPAVEATYPELKFEACAVQSDNMIYSDTDDTTEDAVSIAAGLLFPTNP